MLFQALGASVKQKQSTVLEKEQVYIRWWDFWRYCNCVFLLKSSKINYFPK